MGGLWLGSAARIDRGALSISSGYFTIPTVRIAMSDFVFRYGGCTVWVIVHITDLYSETVLMYGDHV